MDNVNDATQQAPETEAGQALAASAQAPDTLSGETPQNDAAGVEQNETPSEGQSQEAKELILGKFKSQEDLENAYKELESHSKKVEMERSDLEKLFVKPESQEAAPTEEQTSQATDIKSALEQVRPALRDEVTKLLAPTIAKLEVQDMINKYGDSFTAVAKDVAKLKDEKNISMEDAYKLATYGNVQRTSYNQGVSNSEKVNEQKQKAEVESSNPSGSRPQPLDEAVSKIGKDVDVAEVAEALGPEYAEAFGKRHKARLER